MCLCLASICPAFAQQGEAGHAQSIDLTRLIVDLLDGKNVGGVESPLPPDLLEPVHLEQTVALALQHNFEVKASEYAGKAASTDTYSSYAQYLPSYTVILDHGKNFSTPSAVSDSSGNKIPDLTHYLEDRTYTYHQPLIDLTVISDMLEKNELADVASYNTISTRERIAFQAVTAFYQMLQAMIAIRAAQDYEMQFNTLYDRMVLRVQGGGSSEVELERIKSRQVTAQSAVLAAKSSYAAALYDYQRLTGVVPAQLAVPQNNIFAALGDEATLVQQAYQNSPDLIALKHQIDSLDYEEDKVAAKVLPTFSFDYSKSIQDNVDGAGQADPATVAPNYYPQQQEKKWMFTLTWALNPATVPQAVAAHYRKLATMTQLTDSQTKIKESIRLAINVYKSSETRIPFVKRSIDALRQTTSAFEAQYDAGSRSLIDLLDSYERLYQAQNDLSSLAIQQALGYFQIQQSIGHIVDALKAERAEP